MAKETHSIRMAQETYDALAEYAHQKAASLAEAIEALLKNVATLDVARITPERAAELEAFQHAIKTILDMYLHSITIKDDVAAQARESVKGELIAKDARIDVSGLYELMNEIKQGLPAPKKDVKKKAEYAGCGENEQLSFVPNDVASVKSESAPFHEKGAPPAPPLSAVPVHGDG